MFGPKEIMVVLIVLAIVLLLFGPKRIKNLGSELGNAIRGFRHAVSDKEASTTANAEAEVEKESVAHRETAQATEGTANKQNV